MEIHCPNLECNQLMNRRMLKWHLQEECIVSQQRKAILEAAAMRKKQKESDELHRQQEALRILEINRHIKLADDKVKTSKSRNLSDVEETEEERDVVEPDFVLCQLCGEGVKESALYVHSNEKCPFRKVICPNYGQGCNEKEVPFIEMNNHLKSDCNAEKWKEKLIANSKRRQMPLQCSTCGDFVPLSKWRRHENELCGNRLVPCRNQHLGCAVMVPLAERAMHELVAEDYQRFSLYLPGHGMHLAIEENDIACPWTAEVRTTESILIKPLLNRLTLLFLAVQ